MEVRGIVHRSPEEVVRPRVSIWNGLVVACDNIDRRGVGFDDSISSGNGSSVILKAGGADVLLAALCFACDDADGCFPSSLVDHHLFPQLPLHTRPTSAEQNKRPWNDICSQGEIMVKIANS
jgi:hypothetical protein